eukprot:scaffold3202_cov407-Prasinococcus_capsulatus_cf.AAC.9
MQYEPNPVAFYPRSRHRSVVAQTHAKPLAPTAPPRPPVISRLPRRRALAAQSARTAGPQVLTVRQWYM